MDGLASDAVARLGNLSALGNIRALGASTLDARTAVESTRTLPNHTGMLTGRRVEAARGGHGVVVNDDDGRLTVDRASGSSIDSVFDVAHRAGLSTALIASKSKFAVFERSWPDAVDDFTVVRTPAQVISRGLRAVTRAPGFVFAHVALPDTVGHARGFGSPAYAEAVQTVDDALELLAARLRDGSLPTTAIVVTADHGGDADGHGQVGDPADFTVPFVVVGPGVPAGSSLEALVGVRAPRRAQAAYDGPQPVRNADVANVATGLLGLPRVPGSEFTAVRDALELD